MVFFLSRPSRTSHCRSKGKSVMWPWVEVPGGLCVFVCVCVCACVRACVRVYVCVIFIVSSPGSSNSTNSFKRNPLFCGESHVTCNITIHNKIKHLNKKNKIKENSSITCTNIKLY